MKERAPGANPSSNRLVRVVPRRMKERAPGSRSRWDEMSWGEEIDEAVAMAKAPLRDYVAWLLHVAAPPSRETLEVTASRKRTRTHARP